MLKIYLHQWGVFRYGGTSKCFIALFLLAYPEFWSFCTEKIMRKIKVNVGFVLRSVPVNVWPKDRLKLSHKHWTAQIIPKHKALEFHVKPMETVKIKIDSNVTETDYHMQTQNSYDYKQTQTTGIRAVTIKHLWSCAFFSKHLFCCLIVISHHAVSLLLVFTCSSVVSLLPGLIRLTLLAVTVWMATSRAACMFNFCYCTWWATAWIMHLFQNSVSPCLCLDQQSSCRMIFFFFFLLHVRDWAIKFYKLMLKRINQSVLIRQTMHSTCHWIQMTYVHLVGFMYLVFTCMPSENYCRWLRSFFAFMWGLSSSN